MYEGEGTDEIMEVYLSFREEALERLQRKFSERDISDNPKVLFFCDQLAFRIKDLVLLDTRSKDTEEKIQKVIDELLNLPLDIISHSELSSKKNDYQGSGYHVSREVSS